MAHKILCAVDFSPPARIAMQDAAEHARLSGAALVLAYVSEATRALAVAHTPISPMVMQELVDSEQRTLAAWAEDARKLGAREVTHELLTGVAWDEIVRLAARDPAIDLVVVGTHGRTGLRRALIGSVAEKIVRHAPCPVLVTRDRTTS